MGRPAQFIGKLAAALGLTALLLALPAWQAFGSLGLIAVGGAVIACFLPGVLLALAGRHFRGANRPLQMLLTGTGLRVGIVLIAGFLLVSLRPELKTNEFFLGLAVVYMVALVVETRELMAEVGPTPSSRQPQAH